MSNQQVNEGKIKNGNNIFDPVKKRWVKDGSTKPIRSTDGAAGAALDDFAPEESVESDYSDAKVMANGTKDFSHLKGKDRTQAMQEEIIEGMNDIAIKPEEYKELLSFMAKRYNYSFRNQLLLMMQKPDGLDYKTYKQWAALGYSVAKGSRGASVLRPILVKKKESENTPNTADTEDKKEDLIPVGYSSYAVFSDRDLDASVKEPPRDPLSQHIQRYQNNPDITDVSAMRQDIEMVAKDLGVKISYESKDTQPRFASGDVGGFARKSQEDGYNYEIVINTGSQDHAQTYTLAHEIGHVVCGHVDDTEKRNYSNRDDRGSMEVEAESIAYAISRDYGLQTDTASFAYIKSWAKNDPQKVSSTFNNVSKGISKYYERLEKLATGTTKKEVASQANKSTQSARKKRTSKKK